MSLTQERSFHEYYYKGAPYEPADHGSIQNRSFLPKQVTGKDLQDNTLAEDSAKALKKLVRYIAGLIRTSTSSGFFDVTTEVFNALSRDIKDMIKDHINAIKREHARNVKATDQDIKEFIRLVTKETGNGTQYSDNRGFFNKVIEKIRTHFSRAS